MPKHARITGNPEQGYTIEFGGKTEVGFESLAEAKIAADQIERGARQIEETDALAETGLDATTKQGATGRVRNAILGWTMVVLIVGVPSGGWWFYHARETAREKAAQLEIKAEKEAKSRRLVDFAKRYDAITHWDANLPKRRWGGRLMSVEVSRALIPSNGRPVLLLEMGLQDVAEKQGVYTARFYKPYLTNQTCDLDVELKCTPQQAQELLNISDRPDELESKYAVVARIEWVSLPNEFIQSDTPTFSAKGVCINWTNAPP